MKWQNKFRAWNRTHSLYAEPGRVKARCVIHGSTREERVELHHLNESGEKSKFGWFFENLVPVCRGDNRAIEDTRPAKEMPEPADLQPMSLSSRAETHERSGQIVQAYACARLGSFISAYWNRPGWADHNRTVDRIETLQLATQCLLYLRGVSPGDGIPLAVDTLDRSILPNLEIPVAKWGVLPDVLFGLSTAAGVFHREYGDLMPARRYFELAERFSDGIAGHKSSSAYGQFLNHKLILEVGCLEAGLSSEREVRELRERLLGETDYVNRSYGDLDVKLWTLKQKLLKNRKDEVLADVVELGKKYFRQQSFFTPVPERKYDIQWSPWMHAVFLVVTADAYFRPEAKPVDRERAEELMKTAVSKIRDGHYSIAAIAQPRIVAELYQKYPKAFSFPLRDAKDLATRWTRTAGQKELSFQDVSKRLMDRLLQ